MRIGIYVSGVAGRPGFENLVSGHIQLPLQTIRLLRDAGVEVELITSAHSAGSTMPHIMPDDVRVHEVADGRVREIPDGAESFADGSAQVAPGRPTRGVSPTGLIKIVKDMRALCRERDLDLIHFFGHNRTAYLAGAMRWLRLPVPVVVTLVGVEPIRKWSIGRLLMERIDHIIVSSEFGKKQLAGCGIEATTVRHGTTRDIMSELASPRKASRDRVLFWRDPSRWNGADIALAAFGKLAPEYPDVSFDFAVRPFYDEVHGLDETAASHANIHVHRFPYRDGISLAGLLAESLCVVTPFRTTSVDPQLSLAETLAAGVAVITTDIRSNGELVRTGVNGTVVRTDDVAETTDALKEMLDNPERTMDMGQRAPALLRQTWNWDDYATHLIDVYRLTGVGTHG